MKERDEIFERIAAAQKTIPPGTNFAGIAAFKTDNNVRRYHLGHDVWLAEKLYTGVLNDSKTPAQLAGNLTTAVFLPQELLKSTRTGYKSRRCGRGKEECNKLDPIKLAACETYYKYWMENHYTPVTKADVNNFDLDFRRFNYYCAKKISDYKKPAKKRELEQDLSDHENNENMYEDEQEGDKEIEEGNERIDEEPEETDQNERIGDHRPAKIEQDEIYKDEVHMEEAAGETEEIEKVSEVEDIVIEKHKKYSNKEKEDGESENEESERDNDEEGDQGEESEDDKYKEGDQGEESEDDKYKEGDQGEESEDDKYKEGDQGEESEDDKYKEGDQGEESEDDKYKDGDQGEESEGEKYEEEEDQGEKTEVDEEEETEINADTVPDVQDPLFIDPLKMDYESD